MTELFEYITIQLADIFNNNGAKMTTWPKDHLFTTGEYVRNGQLYLGTDGVNNINRWINVGTYTKVIPTEPPPIDDGDEDDFGEEINLRIFQNRVLVKNSWYKKVEELP